MPYLNKQNIGYIINVKNFYFILVVSSAYITKKMWTGDH